MGGDAVRSDVDQGQASQGGQSAPVDFAVVAPTLLGALGLGDVGGVQVAHGDRQILPGGRQGVGLGLALGLGQGADFGRVCGPEPVAVVLTQHGQDLGRAVQARALARPADGLVDAPTVDSIADHDIPVSVAAVTTRGVLPIADALVLAHDPVCQSCPPSVPRMVDATGRKGPRDGGNAYTFQGTTTQRAAEGRVGASS